MKTKFRFAVTALLISCLTGCITQRTITENGHTVSQEYKVTRPIKEALAE